MKNNFVVLIDVAWSVLQFQGRSLIFTRLIWMVVKENQFQFALSDNLNSSQVNFLYNLEKYNLLTVGG